MKRELTPVPCARRTEPSVSTYDGHAYVQSHSTNVLETMQHAIRKGRKDLSGQRFGSLTVVADGGVVALKQCWQVRCDCGTESVVRANSLLTGNTKSCGCSSGAPRSHGHAKKGSETRTYRIWASMMARGRGQISPDHYADRGITVCERWMKFENFLADMGDAPEEMSIDRIDNNGNYEPSNCRWATHREQMRNTSANVFLEDDDGRRMCLSDWAEELAISRTQVSRRVAAGQTVTEIKALPARKSRG